MVVQLVCGIVFLQHAETRGEAEAAEEDAKGGGAVEPGG